MKMKSSGIIMTINDDSGYVILIGSVSETQEGEKNGNTYYLVRLAYEEDDEQKKTDIYFWNDPEADDFRRYQADHAKQKNLQSGSVIAVRCRFRDASKKEAIGYGINYNGLIRVRPDSEHELDNRSVLIGTVLSMKKVLIKGENALKLKIYAGKRFDGVYRNVYVTLTGELAMRAQTDLAEQVSDNKVIRKNAAFRCGSISEYFPPMECPICLEEAKYDPVCKQMKCENCGVQFAPPEDKQIENVFAYNYFVTGEREYIYKGEEK